MIEIYKSPKMYRFLHMPIQSASDKVLLDMNRNYKFDLPEKIIKKFKKEIPNMTLATDIIVGYPTEKNEDHIKNIDFIKSFKPDVLNLSKFSAHKLTPAEKLKPLDIKIVNKRASEIMELHRKTALENKKKFQDQKVSVFVNKKTLVPNTYESRDDNYNIVLLTSKDKSILGKTIDVTIKSLGVHHMLGETI
jgi:tRNA A37 methylthiotransferase MiaB